MCSSTFQILRVHPVLTAVQEYVQKTAVIALPNPESSLNPKKMGLRTLACHCSRAVRAQWSRSDIIFMYVCGPYGEVVKTLDWGP